MHKLVIAILLALASPASAAGLGPDDTMPDQIGPESCEQWFELEGEHLRLHLERLKQQKDFLVQEIEVLKARRERLRWDRE